MQAYCHQISKFAVRSGMMAALTWPGLICLCIHSDNTQEVCNTMGNNRARQDKVLAQKRKTLGVNAISADSRLGGKVLQPGKLMTSGGRGAPLQLIHLLHMCLAVRQRGKRQRETAVKGRAWGISCGMLGWDGRAMRFPSRLSYRGRGMELGLMSAQLLYVLPGSLQVSFKLVSLLGLGL